MPSSKSYHRDYHVKNYATKIKDRQDTERAARLDYIRRLKEQPCADCGQTYPSVCMDFDHVRGVKKYLISKMANDRRSIEAIDAEVAKCDIVCANCHRIRTFRGSNPLPR